MPDTDMSGAEPVGPSESNIQTRKTRPRRRRRRRRPIAALDLGTNNCRLLIAKPTEDNFRVIDSYSRIVRLGQGLASSGQLSQQSMDAAVEALKVCSSKMQHHKVKQWRCVATQACRQADNGQEFLKRVKAETGIRLEVISPRVESRLAVMGCLNLIDTQKNVVLVVDVGGGSTELSWVDVRRFKAEASEELSAHRPPISAWASIPIGVVTLSERIPEYDDRTAWYEELKTAVKDELVKAGCEHRFTKMFKSGKGHIIGTSGTITTLAAAHLNLPFYKRNKIDGLWMETASVMQVSRDMAYKSPKERAAIPVIGEDRAKLLVAGCAIMDVICEMWPSKRIRVADRGLREGILLGLMQKKQAVSQQ